MPAGEDAIQILISSGTDAPEKVVLGLATALCAVHSGIAVRLVFAMRGAVWCSPTRGNDQRVPGYPPIGTMIDELVEEGAQVYGCSSCIDQYCPSPMGQDGLKVLRQGMDRIGLTRVTIDMVSISTVTF